MRRLIDAQQELNTHQTSLDSLKQSILREEAQVQYRIFSFTYGMGMLMRGLGQARGNLQQECLRFHSNVQ